MLQSLTPLPPKKKPLHAPLIRILALILMAGCTKSPEPSPEIPILKSKLDAALKRMVDAELELRTAGADPELGADAAEDKELLRSRIERIKEKLMHLGGLPREDEAASAHH